MMIEVCKKCNQERMTCNKYGFCLSCRVSNNFPRYMIYGEKND